MASSTLTQIAKSRTALEQDFLSKKSIIWFQENLKELRSPIKLAKEIANEKSRKGGIFSMGGLYHYFYDPLTKDELPYYDIFPLVIPLNSYSDGFLGLNLHYLPPLYRAEFMDRLMNFAILNDKDEPKRLRVTYDILSTVRNLRAFRPCLKRYLSSQIRSKILTIKPSEWETALFLPTAVFHGAKLNKVYTESIQKAKARTY